MDLHEVNGCIYYSSELMEENNWEKAYRENEILSFYENRASSYSMRKRNSFCRNMTTRDHSFAFYFANILLVH